MNNIPFFIIPNGIHPNIFLDNYGYDLSNNMLLLQYQKKSYNEFTHFALSIKGRICDELEEYNKKYPMTKDTHPGIKAHRLWAELSAEYLKKNLEKSFI